jgi:arylsulfatase A-like enzyme
VSLLDLTPTLAEIAGASAPPEVEGRSLVPALQGKALEVQPIFSESLYRVPQELKSVRQDEYKLIYNVDDGSIELYDLGADPTEQKNISAEAIQVTSEMKSALLAWMAHIAQVAEELPRDAPPAEFKDAPW